jgi:hypothetical protein
MLGRRRERSTERRIRDRIIEQTTARDEERFVRQLSELIGPLPLRKVGAHEVEKLLEHLREHNELRDSPQERVVGAVLPLYLLDLFEGEVGEGVVVQAARKHGLLSCMDHDSSLIRELIGAREIPITAVERAPDPASERTAMHDSNLSETDIAQEGFERRFIGAPPIGVVACELIGFVEGHGRRHRARGIRVGLENQKIVGDRRDPLERGQWVAEVVENAQAEH